MDLRPIGVFDSGLGGLTAVRRLMQRLPGEDIVYFGDTGRVPYGTRSAATIAEYAGQDCRFLEKQNVKLIIAACGTVSSVAPHVLRQAAVPAFGVVEPTAAAAAAATRNGRVGILGTSATVRSGAYEQQLRQIDPSLATVAQACPLFVSLVESGWIARDDEAAVAVAKRYLQPMRDAGVDTLILGCTHFPLLSDIFRDRMGDGVTLIDSGACCADACARLLDEKGLASGRAAGGEGRFFVSDRPEDFSAVAHRFLGREIGSKVLVAHAEEPAICP